MIFMPKKYVEQLKIRVIKNQFNFIYVIYKIYSIEIFF